MMLEIALHTGMIAISIGFLLLMLSYLPVFKAIDSIGSASLRVIAAILSLGGLLCISSAYMDLLITRYAFIIVGLLLISASCVVAYDLRPVRRKRKAKPKN